MVAFKQDKNSKIIKIKLTTDNYFNKFVRNYFFVVKKTKPETFASGLLLIFLGCRYR